MSFRLQSFVPLSFARPYGRICLLMSVTCKLPIFNVGVAVSLSETINLLSLCIRSLRFEVSG